MTGGSRTETDRQSRGTASAGGARPVRSAVPHTPTVVEDGYSAGLTENGALLIADARAIADQRENTGNASEDSARLALQRWLQSVDPPRSIPRSSTFFSTMVQSLWTGDLHAPQDLAEYTEADIAQLSIESPTARVFLRTVALPAARQQYGTSFPEQPALPPVLGMDQAALMQAQLAAFAQLGVMQQQQQPQGALATVDLHLDLHEELDRLGLGGLPHESTPCGRAVDALHTKAEKLKKLGKRVPFVMVSLRTFLPPWARSSGHMGEEDEEQPDSETVKAMQKVMNIKKAKHELTFLQSMAALEVYAVAGAVAKQFLLSSGLAHCGVIKHVAHRAGVDGKRHVVAVAYDELVREKWASLAYQAGSAGTFDIDAAMSCLDESVYVAAASRVMAKPAVVPAADSEKKGTGKGNQDLECHYCGRKGHKKSDCYKLKAALKADAQRPHAGESETGPAKRHRKW